MLLVALGVLTLLSLLGLAFATQMSIEKKASQNYVEGVRARLIAEAALARAQGEMRFQAAERPYTTAKDTYARGDFWLPLELSSEVMDKGNDPYRPSYIGVLGQTYNNGADRYKIKIIDTQAQLNLNNSHPESTYKLMVRALGKSISQEIPRINDAIRQAAQNRGISDFQDKIKPVGDPFERARFRAPANSPYAGQLLVGADALWALKQTKPNTHFISKSELLEIMDPADYEVVRDFLTARSWNDPKAVEHRGLSFDRVAVDGAVMGHVKHPGSNGEVKSPADETIRAPININIAPRSVLTAAIAPVAGRRLWINDRFENAEQKLDAGTDYENDYTGDYREQMVNQGHSTDDSITSPAGYGALKYLIYFPPVGYRFENGVVSFTPFCDQFVDAIIDRRENIGPFKSYQEWDHFVETAVLNIVGGASTTGASASEHFNPTGDYQPTLVRYDNGRKAISTASTLYREITGDPRFVEWYRRSYIGMLKSNFNPNGRFSQMNPDETLFVEVDKGNLRSLRGPYFLVPGTSSTTGPVQTGGAGGAVGAGTSGIDLTEESFQTLEWCFSSRGIFEIVVLGEVAGELANDTLRSYGFPAPAGAGPVDQKPQIYAQEKLRAVIQIFDQLTHTSQMDFLKNGQEGRGRDPQGQQFFGFPRIDGKEDSAARANLAAYPVSERRWLPQGSGEPIPPVEYGGSSLFERSDEADGYLSLRGRYFTSTQQTEGETPIRDVYIKGNVNPPELFRLGMDYGRTLETFSSPLNYINPVQQQLLTPDRLGLMAADVGGGLRYTGSQSVYAPPNDIYTTQQGNLFGLPLPPATANLLQRNSRIWLTSDAAPQNFHEKWLADFAYVDGYYAGESRRPNAARNYYFPEYRAAYPEQVGIGGGYHYNPNPEYQQGNIATTRANQRHLRGTDRPWQDNVQNLRVDRGLISFWYKPDFDWVDANDNPSPRYCGFFSSTHVVEPEVPAVNGKSPATSLDGARRPRSFRGTQTYFTRESRGALRVTRLYFEVAGQDGEAIPGSTAAHMFESPYVLNPHVNDDPTLDGPNAPIVQQQWLTLDDYKKAVENYFVKLSEITGNFGKGGAAGGTPALTFDDLRYYPWPPRELYVRTEAEAQNYTERQFARIRTGRYDSWVDPIDVPKLKKGQWYFITMGYNDADPTIRNRVRISIDGEPLRANTFLRGDKETYPEAYNWTNNSDNSGRMDVPTVTPPAPGTTTPITTYPGGSRDQFLRNNPEHPTFVRLNAIIDMSKFGALKDSISIGGFSRGQYFPKSGVFKYRAETNQRASLPANGTVDDFISYELDEAPQLPAIQIPDPVRYFEEGVWTQRIDLRSLYDATGAALKILAVDFDAYMPYERINNAIAYDPQAEVDVSVITAAGGIPFAAAPYKNAAGSIQGWRGSDNGAIIAPRIGFSGNQTLTVQRGETLNYQIRMRAGAKQRRWTSGRKNLFSASTPIFDAIRVTYQLRKPNILVRERVFD